MSAHAIEEDRSPAVEGAAPVPEQPLPVIGVDPGQTWTAAVLRIGDYGAHGWTIGPIDLYGTVRRDALNNPDDWDAFGRYVDRLVAALDDLAAYAEDHYGEVRVAVEVPTVPIGYQPGSARKFQKLPLRDWLLPRQVACAILGRYPGAKRVFPDGHGGRPASEYPAELRGTRPPGWGPNEVPNRERDHERAAYDVAGVAARMPR